MPRPSSLVPMPAIWQMVDNLPGNANLPHLPSVSVSAIRPVAGDWSSLSLARHRQNTLLEFDQTEPESRMDVNLNPATWVEIQMSYLRFGLMITVSTVVMFGLMYLNTFAVSHVFYSQTRTWMALIMGATMAIIMLAFMWSMYPSRMTKITITAASVVAFAISLWMVRSQETVYDVSYMKAMIPHHSIAIMTSARAHIKDPRVRSLADKIIEAQVREIKEMELLIAELAENPPPDHAPDLPPSVATE